MIGKKSRMRRRRGINEMRVLRFKSKNVSAKIIEGKERWGLNNCSAKHMIFRAKSTEEGCD